MKRHLFYLPVFWVCLAGCAAAPQPRLPELTGAAGGQGKEICAAVFPEGKWQFAHAIDFAMKDGSGTPVIGVTSLTGSDIECALVTVEGLTLFEAVFHHDASIEVRRAVPPFDGPDFAKGMISDIRAIFQPPTGSMRIGQTAGKTPVCRYVGGDGSVVDVLPDTGDCWQIKSYTSKGTMDRSIVGRSCQKIGSSLIPDYLELKTFSQTGYTLKMTLLTADNFK